MGQVVVGWREKWITWHGLKLWRKLPGDYFRSKGRPFEWEVDASPDEDDEYQARVYWNGIKLASGKGIDRHAALTQTMQELSRLETQIGNELHTRRKGARGDEQKKNRPRDTDDDPHSGAGPIGDGQQSGTTPDAPGVE